MVEVIKKPSLFSESGVEHADSQGHPGDSDSVPEWGTGTRGWFQQGHQWATLRSSRTHGRHTGPYSSELEVLLKTNGGCSGGHWQGWCWYPIGQAGCRLRAYIREAGSCLPIGFLGMHLRWALCLGLSLEKLSQSNNQPRAPFDSFPSLDPSPCKAEVELQLLQRDYLPILVALCDSSLSRF